MTNRKEITADVVLSVTRPTKDRVLALREVDETQETAVVKLLDFWDEHHEGGSENGSPP